MNPTPRFLRDEEHLAREFGVEHPAGGTIFREDDPGNVVFMVSQGKVQIATTVGEKSKVLAVLGPGEFFGEMALVGQRPRNATATALEETRLLAIDGELFEKVLRDDYDAALRIIGQLAARLADADKKLDVLLLTDATTRLVRFLEGLPPGQTSVDLEVLTSDLAVPLERLQRIAAKLEEKGVVTIEGARLTVTGQEKLRKLWEYLSLKDEFGKLD
jgi:CRP-like cAMP-binding protein